MTKTLYLALTCIIFFVACSKKIHPSSIIPSAPSAPTVVSTPTAMIVIDGYGKILTPQSKLPTDGSIKTDYSKSARSFTPTQLANLTYRYHTLPPRILYVPAIYTLKSLRGIYCVYKKKFWYWKNEDGLFYLDETYYK